MPKTDIIDDLLTEESRLEAARVETIKQREVLTTARLLITQLRGENAELRHHLNPAPAGPITDAEAPL